MSSSKFPSFKKIIITIPCEFRNAVPFCVLEQGSFNMCITACIMYGQQFPGWCFLSLLKINTVICYYFESRTVFGVFVIFLFIKMIRILKTCLDPKIIRGQIEKYLILSKLNQEGKCSILFFN